MTITKKLLLTFLLALTITVATGIQSSQANTQTIEVYIDQSLQLYDQSPLIVDNRTLVPLRGIFEKLGAKVDWQAQTRTVIVLKDERVLALRIGSSYAYLNGSLQQMDVQAQIYNNRTMVPLRFVSEWLGANVDWDASLRRVSISTAVPGTVMPARDNGDPSSSLAEFEAEVFKQVNTIRKQHSLPLFEHNSKLSSVARIKSEDMRDSDYFDHVSPNYGKPWDMLKHYGIFYSRAAENIAAGQRTPADVVEAWMNSEGHRANILNENLTQLGVGFATGGPYRTYWTQLFISQ